MTDKSDMYLVEPLNVLIWRESHIDFEGEKRSRIGVLSVEPVNGTPTEINVRPIKQWYINLNDR